MTRPKPTETDWVTKDGQVIPVAEMADSHLVNTIRYLRRRYLVAKEQQAASMATAPSNMLLAGDAALDALEDAIRDLDDCSLDEFIAWNVPCWEHMLDEVERRDLDVEQPTQDEIVAASAIGVETFCELQKQKPQVRQLLFDDDDKTRSTP